MTATKTKKRILEALRISEISGVDRPAQEGARVAIMKRNETQESKMEVEELEGAVIDLEARMAHLNKALEAANVKPKSKDVEAKPDFATTVAEIRKRDNCSRTEALVKARKEQPESFAAYSAGPTNADFDKLVEAEIAKGVAPSVAAQRVGLRHPEATAAAIAKQDRHPFLKLVDNIQEQDGCSRAVAMSRARKKSPEKFFSYQEG
jgi:hypothetical protein